MGGKIIMNIGELKSKCLVLDIETWAEFDNGMPINIKTNFDDYVALAQVKWVGFYSYKHNKEYYLEVSKNRKLIRELIEEHDIYIGFNNAEFDCPILTNNGLFTESKYPLLVDCRQILCSSTFKDREGRPFKDRGNLMDYSFSRTSLECVAETMELEFQKSTIDYKIFAKNSWDKNETEEIIKYLRNDVMANKGMFDKMWDYWMPFTQMLSDKDIENLSWIRSSIASLIYKSICYLLGTEPEYDDSPKKKEAMGGNVFEPTDEEVVGAWYLDVASLYPHVQCMFNLFSEVSPDTIGAWHGNDVFKVKGYYDITYKSKLAKIVEEMLVKRFELKKNDPTNPLVYTYKIFLNGLYGVLRSARFKTLHTENIGWDTCWIGQQIQQIFAEMMFEFGFRIIAGDTDSIMVKALKEEYNNKKYVEKCILKVIRKIYENAPFPVDTFDIKIEHYLEYIMFPFSEEKLVDEETRKSLKDNIIEGYTHALDENNKKIIIDDSTGEIVKTGNKWARKWIGKKKNYMYIYEKNGERKIEVVGMPLKKDNATPLGYKIFTEVLTPKILKDNRAKFEREFIYDTINEYLKDEEIMRLVAVEFKVQPEKTYKIPKGKKEASGIHAQISRAYFNGQDGVISLIKNKKVGDAGKSAKYCTVEQAIANKLTVEDLELDKLFNELEPFILRNH